MHADSPIHWYSIDSVPDILVYIRVNLRYTHSVSACSVAGTQVATMLKLSLLLVAAILLNRKLHRDFGWICVSAVVVGYIWPTWLLLPYIIIVWRISKDFLESGRVSFQTNFPLFIGRRRSSSAKHHQSADWIVAIEVPPSEQNRQLNFNNDDKIYLVTKAIPKVYSDGSRKQLLKSKTELNSHNYQLHHIGWVHRPDMSAITINEPISSQYSCHESAINLALQITTSKIYTYICDIVWLRHNALVCYALLMFFAEYEMYDVQPVTMFLSLPFGRATMLNFIVTVEIWWLQLGTEEEEMHFDKVKEWLVKDYIGWIKVTFGRIKKWVKPYFYSLLETYNSKFKPVVHEQRTVDLAQQYEMHGSKVVEAVIDRIARSEIFENNFGYIRRISWVETKDGLEKLTFRPNYYGGLWQMDEKVFKQTKDTYTYPTLTEKFARIQSEFQINWVSVQWKDLRKPLHCGLAVHLYMFTREEKIPLNVKDQAEHWKRNYNREHKQVVTFVDEVVKIESMKLKGTCITIAIVVVICS